MRRYLSLTKGGFMSFAAYPYSFFFSFLGNLLYIAVVYFLWSSIYRNTRSLNGMTLGQTLIYLTLAGSIFVLFKTWTEWYLSNRILNGSIVVELVKPLDLQLQMLFLMAGSVLANLLFIVLPSAVVVALLFFSDLSLGVALAFVPVSLVLAFILSFTIDYMTGIASFYTESLWGISITKDVVVSFLSGALIPLQFFPPDVQTVLSFLPFQAIYHIPLTLVTARSLDLADCLRMVAIQLAWVLVLWAASRLFYGRAVQNLSISGG